jgi:predicted transcriptional regulator
MNEVTIHVRSLKQFFGEAIETAKRIDQGRHTPTPASIAFESMELLLKVLTPNRWALLRVLRASGPSSIRALAQELQRDYRGVHADVTALINAGLISRDDGKVSVPWSRITAEMVVDAAA